MMNRLRTTGSRVVAVCMLSLGVAALLAGCHSGPTAEDIIARMREVEASTENAHAIAEFSLALEGLEGDLVVEMWEKRPNQFRAEVLEDSTCQFLGVTSVTDGQQVWLYHPGENEVVTGRVGELGLEDPLSPQQLIGLMRDVIDYVLDHSDVELIGEEIVSGVNTYKLVFTPRADEEARLPLPLMGVTTLWVEKDRWVVLKAQVAGGPIGEGLMAIRIYQFNEGVPDDRFRFVAPDGAVVRTIEEMQPTHLTLDEALVQAGFAMRVPAYVPEGATLIDVLRTDDRYVLRYDHGEVAFSIVQSLSAQEPTLPAGDARKITLRGYGATLISTGQGNALVSWREDGISITVGGRISEEEIIKVAESLR